MNPTRLEQMDDVVGCQRSEGVASFSMSDFCQPSTTMIPKMNLNQPSQR